MTDFIHIQAQPVDEIAIKSQSVLDFRFSPKQVKTHLLLPFQEARFYFGMTCIRTLRALLELYLFYNAFDRCLCLVLYNNRTTG